jgi:AcrR family transcriptional regulator
MLHCAMSLRRPASPSEQLRATDSPRQTQAERREAAERGILEAAVQIVADRGLEELTLNEAGEAAGYSRALPAHYYKTKSALLQALADHIMAGYAARMRSATLASAGLERLCNILEFCIADAVENPNIVRTYQTIIAAGLNRPELRPIVEHMTRQGIDDLAGLIRQGQEKGEIRGDARPRAEASIIVASLRGVLFQWLISPDHVSLLRMRDCLVTNVRNTLKA